MLNKIFKVILLLLLGTNIYASSFSLKIEADKKEIYLGDKVNLKLTFTYTELEYYELPEISSTEFTLKEIRSVDYKKDDKTNVEEVFYELTPLNTNKLRLGELEAKIEVLTGDYKNLNNKSQYTKKISIYSNSININVKPIPEGVSVIGAYSLNATVDKLEAKTGEVITLKLELQGEGNIDNLDTLNIEIPNTTSYYTMSTKNRFTNTYTKTFELISDRNFVIPSFELEYFDKEAQAKRSSKTKEFYIHITDSKVQKVIPKMEKTSNIDKIVYFALGVLASLLIFFIYKIFKKFKRIKKEPTLINELKKMKTKNDLYKKIVPYLKKDMQLDELIYELENEEYKSFKNIKTRIIKTVVERKV